MNMQTVETSTPNLPQEFTSSPALILTPNAINKIRDFSQKIPEAKGKFFRVSVEGGGCSGMQYAFNFDDVKTGDEIISSEDIKVLLDQNSKNYIAGSTVDFFETLTSSGFTVTNPKAKASCGCGTSFSV